jgi:type II secretory pathway pseudopilin PulG
LIELVIVMVLVGALSAYVLITNASPGAYTVLSQAQTMASNLRHVQTLASTLGKTLRVSVTTGANGSYSVTCVTPGASPCNSSAGVPMTNPVTGSSFTVSLQRNVALSVLSGTTPLDINSQGQPGAAVTFRLTSGTATKDVSVAALTGFVNVP